MRSDRYSSGERERQRETRGWYLSREYNKRSIRSSCVTTLIVNDRLTGVAFAYPKYYSFSGRN